MTLQQQDRRLADVVYSSFMVDIDALKPGNVSRYAPGHGMRVDDFIKSADLITPVLCNRDLSVGKRILSSVEVTMEGVGCNTNLGLILLFAPLIFAAQHKLKSQSLRESLADILKAIDRKESADIFRAICLANPAGLGQSPKYDVHLQPEARIIEAMKVSRDRDRIAFQYVSQFKDIFELGLEIISTALQRWNRIEWATIACYLKFLSEFHDSHVQRKFGDKTARQVRIKAQTIMQEFMSCTEPDSMIDKLLEFDQELKTDDINPGTTADLSVSSVLAYRITQGLL